MWFDVLTRSVVVLGLSSVSLLVDTSLALVLIPLPCMSWGSVGGRMSSSRDTRFNYELRVHMVDELSRAGAAVAVSDGEEKFESWAWMMGISAPKLRHAVFSDPVQGNLRGLQTREATAASETLVTLPKDVAITLMAGEASPFKSWVSPEFWDGQPWYVKLGLKLLWERQLGGASKVKGYVDLLPSPESFETLVHWSDEELAELMYAPCIGSAKRQRLKWDKIHQELVSKCPNGSGRVVSRDDLVWAMECVLSRAFGGRFGGGTEALLAGGAAAAAGVGSYLATGEAWGVALAALALLPLTMREISALSGLGSGAGGRGQGGKGGRDFALVPFVDSMNHVTGATTELSFSPLDGRMRVAIDRAYKAGEQAFISYGLKSNDELLQFYGFVEEDCPGDTYVLEGLADQAGGQASPSAPGISGVRKTGVRGRVDRVTLRRGGEVVNEPDLAALRLLFGGGDEENDQAVWENLLELCEGELARLNPDIPAQGLSPEGGGGGGNSGASGDRSLRRSLAKIFRQEKARVLSEVIADLKRKSG